MRTINHSARMKRDFKREKKGKYRKTIVQDLLAVIALLAADIPLPYQYYDHALIGDWADHRDCHIKPNLVLIYRKPNPETLELVRLGSHSELGL